MNRTAKTKQGQPSVVYVEKSGNHFQLLHNGHPYFIQGAGGKAYLNTLQEAGDNSLRTWGADNLTPLLDNAHRLGITVTVGLWLTQEREGFDYNDADAVYKMKAQTLEYVRQYRNHPAVLMWGLGNEMEGDGENCKIWEVVDDIAKEIKTLDPNHPIMTAVAEVGEGGNKLKHYQEYCQHVDILGINSYGALRNLPARIQKANFQHPYIITEFGPYGHWEVDHTHWDAPIEANSTEKAHIYQRHYQNSIYAYREQCLGSYVFLWGQKQETTSTWFGLFLPSGERLGTMEVMQQQWSGQFPKNRCPQITDLETTVKFKEVLQGSRQRAHLIATDPDGDPLLVRWEVRSESNDRKEGGAWESEPLAHPDCIQNAQGGQLEFRAPREAGAYRLFAFTYDGRGNAATANVPFYVRA